MSNIILLLFFSSLLNISVVAPFDRVQKLLKRSSICPRNFIKLSHRCYFFSNEKSTWPDAFYHCNSMHSNLAIIKNKNQHKLITKIFLSRRNLNHSEYWIGGKYNWNQKQWTWAASGKPITYNGFNKSVAKKESKDNLQWNCLILDPFLEYQWNSRSCFEKEHFICQKKIIKPENYSSLNDIPNPISCKDNNLKCAQNSKFHSKDVKRNKSSRRIKKRPVNSRNRKVRVGETPLANMNDQFGARSRRNQVEEKNSSNNSIQVFYNTYKESKRHDPLYPNVIVEEFSIGKKP